MAMIILYITLNPSMKKMSQIRRVISMGIREENRVKNQLVAYKAGV
jgi:hypothetical protein